MMVVSPCFWHIFPRGCSMIFDCPVDRSWCAQRCCDRAATESLLRRRCADQLRRAHSARRVRDGADAAETELMMRRSCCCDGAAAATELLLRRSCCCDGTAAATELLLRKSCCGDGAVQQQLHRAHSARRVSPYDFSLICSHLPPPMHRLVLSIRLFACMLALIFFESLFSCLGSV